MGKKDDLLGMPFGTAANRLRKSLMFALAQQAEMTSCHRCKEEIISAEDLSIEHVDAWQQAEDPVKAFFDLKNIAFSHLRCNIGAASQPNKIYSTAAEARRAKTTRQQPGRLKARDAWRQRRRAAGLPYT